MIRLTLKFRVSPTSEQEGILRDTISEYTDSYNRVCAVGWEKKRVNGVELHHETYDSERSQTSLPSQLVCSARVRATESLASARALQIKGKKVSCPQSSHVPVRYDARSASIDLAKGGASVASISGRQVLTFEVYEHHKPRIGWKVCSTDLCIDRKGRFWLHISVETAEETVEPTGEVIGVDLGVRRPAVTSQARFLGKSHWREVENRTFRLRRALQAKGTQSARRHLRKMFGRQERFRRDCDHVLSKQMVTSVKKGDTIALEDLTDIRTRMKGRKGLKRRLHSWSFARLQAFMTYKALMAGVFVVYVDPRYTSQKCSKCGHTCRENRRSQSNFHCVKCGFKLNADLNAARNIRANHLASRATSFRSGPFVNRPIVATGDLGTCIHSETSG